MTPSLPTRADALALMHEFTASDSLRKHMLAVEAAMRAYAAKFGEDADRWGLAGLIHDFDYERWPNAAHAADAEHPAEGVRLLRAKGYPEDVLQSILGHATWHLYRKVVEPDPSPRPQYRPRDKGPRHAADFPAVLFPWAKEDR